MISDECGDAARTGQYVRGIVTTQTWLSRVGYMQLIVILWDVGQVREATSTDRISKSNLFGVISTQKKVEDLKLHPAGSNATQQ